jgi:long-subunit fatty acid transport protein
MGRAFTAIVDDADAIFINPAGLASLKGPQAMAMYTNLLNTVYYNELSGAVPTPYGTFGLGYITTGVTGIITNDTPIPTDYYDSMIAVSYAAALSKFVNYGKNVFVGATYKLYNRGYTGGHSDLGQATGFSADVGAKLVVNPYLSFGLCRQNILPISMGSVIRLSSGAEESLLGITKVAAAIRPIPWPDGRA